MDIFALQGLWTNFNNNTAAARGRGKWAAGYYLQLYAAQKRTVQAQEPKRIGLDRMMARLEEEETTNLALFLAEI